MDFSKTMIRFILSLISAIVVVPGYIIATTIIWVKEDNSDWYDFWEMRPFHAWIFWITFRRDQEKQ